MSFYKKNPHGSREYDMFVEGANTEYSLGYEGRPNVANINKALDYIKVKNNHYFEIEKKLLDMLPEPERKEYLSKRTPEIRGWIRRLEEELQKMKQITVPLGPAPVRRLHITPNIKPSRTSPSHGSTNLHAVKKRIDADKKTKKKKKKKT